MPYEQLKLKNQLCFPLYAASRDIVRQYKPFLDPLGLTYTQYIAMMVLWEQGDMSVKTLGDSLHLDSGTLTPLLKKLEASGFITRERSKEDERRLVVHLTPAGRVLEDQAANVPFLLRRCLPLSDDEAATLYRLLYKVIHHCNP